jgi:hypothetical protein
VCLREGPIVPGLHDWVRRLFRPGELPHTVRDLEQGQDGDLDVAVAAQARPPRLKRKKTGRSSQHA